MLALLGGLSSNGARAELLGTHPHPDGAVQLMTEPCRGADSSAGQRARQTVGGRERHGCWGVDRAGNPVVTWRDGSELGLDGDKVRLSRAMAALLSEGSDTPRPRLPAGAARSTSRPQARAAGADASTSPAHRTTAATDFARPAWCPDARFPHERLVCADAELAARDLQLASLWRPYRRTLTRAAEAHHKSDYFRRLKSCGADKACIVDEQAEQMRRYRAGSAAAVPAGSGPASS